MIIENTVEKKIKIKQFIHTQLYLGTIFLKGTMNVLKMKGGIWCEYASEVSKVS